jgi:hypothetical protein
MTKTPNAAEFNDQVQQVREDQLSKIFDPKASQVKKETKMDTAAAKNPAMVQIARRYARTLAKEGPITMDDVNRVMLADGYIVAGGKRNSAQNSWKGSVFKTKEWMCVGQRASTAEANHGRMLRMWALKSWVDEQGGMHGTAMSCSSFNLIGVYHEFKRRNPELVLEDCVWYIGKLGLAPEFRDRLVGAPGDPNAKENLYGSRVILIENAVGAIMSPPPPTTKGD